MSDSPDSFWLGFSSELAKFAVFNRVRQLSSKMRVRPGLGQGVKPVANTKPLASFKSYAAPSVSPVTPVPSVKPTKPVTEVKPATPVPEVKTKKKILKAKPVETIKKTFGDHLRNAGASVVSSAGNMAPYYLMNRMQQPKKPKPDNNYVR